MVRKRRGAYDTFWLMILLLFNLGVFPLEACLD